MSQDSLRQRSDGRANQASEPEVRSTVAEVEEFRGSMAGGWVRAGQAGPSGPR